LIRTANKGERGAVVVVFVHGWNNDASPRNQRHGSLAGFRRTLGSIARQAESQAPGMPLVGIYLGQRGS